MTADISYASCRRTFYIHLVGLLIVSFCLVDINILRILANFPASWEPCLQLNFVNLAIYLNSLQKVPCVPWKMPSFFFAHVKKHSKNYCNVWCFLIYSASGTAHVSELTCSENWNFELKMLITPSCKGSHNETCLRGFYILSEAIKSMLFRYYLTNEAFKILIGYHDLLACRVLTGEPLFLMSFWKSTLW